MIEDIITMLDGMGVEYTEDPETGALVINLEPLDKVQALDIIEAISDKDLPYTLAGVTLTVEAGMPMPEEVPVDAPLVTPEPEEDVQASALDQMMGM